MKCDITEMEYEKLHKDDRGASMIVVTCIMMIVSILCLTLVAASYQMLAGVNDEGRDEMYYRQVMSFSEVLRKDLTTVRNPGDDPTGLVKCIEDFWNGGDETMVMVGKPETSTDEFYELDIKLDKSEVSGCIVVTIFCMDGDTVMASCKSKYRYSGGNFTFYEYY